MKTISAALFMLFSIALHSASLQAVELELSPIQASYDAVGSGLIARVDLQKNGGSG